MLETISTKKYLHEENIGKNVYQNHPWSKAIAAFFFECSDFDLR